MKHTLLVTALWLACSAQVHAELASTFDSGKEGWRGAGDLASLKAKSAGGNPGGYLEGVDQSSGDTWYFVSPKTWMGDWREYKTLGFDLKQIGNGSGFDAEDVIIVGANGKTLTWMAQREPSASWTHYSLPLSPLLFRATQADFDGVMKKVSKVMIRGEFISGSDTGGIDNVVLTDAAPEVKGSVDGLGQYEIRCDNLTTQESQTVSEVVKPDWNCEQMGLTVNDGDVISITITGPAVK